MIEQLLQEGATAPEAGPTGERRRAPRVAYEAVVLVAAQHGNTVPEPSDFIAVQTRDLSVTGISFITASPPNSRSILIVFGQRFKDPIIVSARVVHFLEFSPPPDQRFLVGCELLRRVTPSQELIEVIHRVPDFSLLEQ